MIAEPPLQDICTIEDCDKREHCRGLCHMHYWRLKHHGDPRYEPKFIRIEGLSDHEAIKEKILVYSDVNPSTGCWNWTAKRNEQGYGVLTLNGPKKVTYFVHRLSAMVYLGFDIESELHVCHYCDNSSCCNPEHLFAGTHQDNMDDKVAKGRQYIPSDRSRNESGEWLPKEKCNLRPCGCQDADQWRCSDIVPPCDCECHTALDPAKDTTYTPKEPETVDGLMEERLDSDKYKCESCGRSEGCMHKRICETHGGFVINPEDLKHGKPERDYYTKEETGQKVHDAVVAASTELIKEEREWRRELLRTIECLITDTVRPKTVIPAWKSIIEDLRGRFL